MNKNILVIAGPTCSGESVITQEIIKRHRNFVRLITATTRKPRLNEKNGVDYFFLTKEEFLENIKNGDILEYTYIKNRDEYYGGYKIELEKKLKLGYKIIINPDIVGAKYYKKNYNATTIFIKVRSIDVIEKRLKNRNLDISDKELNIRLENAKEEIESQESFYDYAVLNEQGKLKEAVLEIERILKKEKYL
ncbi:MAG: guanylate kinase [Patescibacteria group bacterium]|nr:guanylate kinase [Patescibacteria group bacterium]MDD4303964.1 guanylate kinase [Patescibacteria group bacterium]MDD4695047.1 guanylate kinase [Patescibacteria group bacterium]